MAGIEPTDLSSTKKGPQLAGCRPPGGWVNGATAQVTPKSNLYWPCFFKDSMNLPMNFSPSTKT
jgi:hypothetical protein